MAGVPGAPSRSVAVGARREPGRRDVRLQRLPPVSCPMKHLPLFFDLRGRRVVVVGEGGMADRRAALAASAGALVSREMYAPFAFDGATAVFVATGDADSDAAAAGAARAAGVPVNVADRPALCAF